MKKLGSILGKALLALLILAFLANYFVRGYWKVGDEFYDRGIVMHWLMGGFSQNKASAE